ncbi:abortive phage resistance protein AbiGi (putative antitoxin) [Halomonas ventosae]|uniref:Abortive phage resistance protein AbiGi (Putative antitoxin) n=1 Tax=Halomonas ventosae TaxID=229007 RepID=A0A4R6ZKJ9_9GAMM|nr:abortive infection system antitoxin AbiGi family protein [Halomonas ventosae]TDR52785.1 abortive phage resistance protein AbiGi (putative antitoxin) [Halomonas ventosae]
MSQRYYSNVYWHFTGSPEGVDWSLARCPKDITEQGAALEPEKGAETLCLILESSKLLATCTETITDGLSTDSFCSVTDIPLKDLPSHSPYYGKVALGFKAKAIHESFVPVLYIPKQNLPAVKRLIPNPELQRMASELFGYGPGFWEQQGMKMLHQAEQNKHEVTEIKKEEVGGFLANFLKITDFDSDPRNTYYREREWRCIGDFYFDKGNIEAVVAPKEVLPMIREKLAELEITETSVLAWEFIEDA